MLEGERGGAKREWERRVYRTELYMGRRERVGQGEKRVYSLYMYIGPRYMGEGERGRGKER